MTDQEIRNIILETAHKVWKRKRKIPFSLFEESDDWGVEEKDLMRNLDYLVQKGWVEILAYKTNKPLVRITVGGIDEYEREHKDS